MCEFYSENVAVEHAGEEKQEQDPSNEPDVRPEDKAIERSEDFEGKMQDLEPAGKNVVLWDLPRYGLAVKQIFAFRSTICCCSVVTRG